MSRDDLCKKKGSEDGEKISKIGKVTNDNVFYLMREKVQIIDILNFILLKSKFILWEYQANMSFIYMSLRNKSSLLNRAKELEQWLWCQNPISEHLISTPAFISDSSFLIMYILWCSKSKLQYLYSCHSYGRITRSFRLLSWPLPTLAFITNWGVKWWINAHMPLEILSLFLSLLRRENYG